VSFQRKGTNWSTRCHNDKESSPETRSVLRREGFSVGEGGLDWTTRYRHLWSGGSWPQARTRIRWTESEFRTVTTVTLEPLRQWLWDRDDNDFGTMTTVTLEPW